MTVEMMLLTDAPERFWSLQALTTYMQSPIWNRPGAGLAFQLDFLSANSDSSLAAADSRNCSLNLSCCFNNAIDSATDKFLFLSLTAKVLINDRSVRSVTRPSGGFLRFLMGVSFRQR